MSSGDIQDVEVVCFGLLDGARKVSLFDTDVSLILF